LPTATTEQTKINYDIVQRKINDYLKLTCSQLSIPFADVWGYTGDYTDTVHLDAAGQIWHASALSGAYENNRVPGNPFGSGSDRFGRF
jgi:hypothetical protein